MGRQAWSSWFGDPLRSQRIRTLFPLFFIALLRIFYHRQQRLKGQYKLHQAFQQLLKDGHDLDDEHGHRPIEEWHPVGDGVETASIVYHPQSKDSNLLILIMPGNPGVPHFYLPLMRALIQRHGPHHEVRTMSHAGHYMPWRNHGRVFDLKEQIEHKLAYIRQRVQENPHLQLVLIGHSIGSFITMEIARTFPDHVVKIIFMQPTIHHIGQSKNGKQMTPFLKTRVGVYLVQLIEYVLPMAFRRLIIKWVIGAQQEEAFHHASLSLVNYRVARNALYMAHLEMEQVLDVDEALIRAHEHKTLFVYSPIDHWVPNETVQMFQLKFPTAKHRMVPQSHAFMMDPDGTRDMADHISQWIDEIV